MTDGSPPGGSTPAMKSTNGAGRGSQPANMTQNQTHEGHPEALNTDMGYPTNPRYPSISHDQLVKETHRISIDYNPVSGRKTLNTYEIVRELGRGEHGKVKLGYDPKKNIYAAIKLLNRKEKPRLGRPQGSSTEEKIHREIAILKKCRHPNIVRLLEVLDDESSRKIYLVLEFCSKGEIKWQTPRGDPALTREQARSVAQNVALGLEYLHLNGIIHRDIKPANLLVSDDNIVKISDFGVSYAVTQDGSVGSELELSKTVGTPAFFSPELCIPTEFNDNGERKTPAINSKVDVWAFGVTLFCFLYGRLPFEADNEYELFRVIATEETVMPDPGDDDDLALANDLMKQLLIKDPIHRPTITEIKHHPWMLKGLSSTQKSGFLHSVESKTIKVSTEEVDQAIKGVSIKSRIKQGISRIVEQMRPKSKDTKDTKDTSCASSVSNSTRSRPKGITPENYSGSTDSNDSDTISELSTSSNASARHASAGHASTSHASTSHGGNASSSNGKCKTSLPNSSDASASAPPSAPTASKVPSAPASAPTAESAPVTHITPPRISIPKAYTWDTVYCGSNQSLDSGESIISSGSESSSSGETTTPIGLMPMHIEDDTSSKTPPLKTFQLQHTGTNTGPSPPFASQLPELHIPRLDSNNIWGDEDSSSSSEDDEYGELTLVVGRNRTRSNEQSGKSPALVQEKAAGSSRG